LKFILDLLPRVATEGMGVSSWHTAKNGRTTVIRSSI
jgi:hypothetical protein